MGCREMMESRQRLDPRRLCPASAGTADSGLAYREFGSGGASPPALSVYRQCAGFALGNFVFWRLAEALWFGKGTAGTAYGGRV